MLTKEVRSFSYHVPTKQQSGGVKGWVDLCACVISQSERQSWAVSFLVNISSSEASVGCEGRGVLLTAPSSSSPVQVPAALLTSGWQCRHAYPKPRPSERFQTKEERESTSTKEVFAQLRRFGSGLWMHQSIPIALTSKGLLENDI